jgi:hypothetical protein
MAVAAALMTMETCRAHALRLTTYAASVSDPIARAEFASIASEWRRLAVLAEWQSKAAIAATQI